MTASRRSRVSVGGQAHHHPVEDDVLARGQLDVEADPELDERRQAAGHPDRAPRRRGRCWRAASAGCSCRSRCGRRCRRTRPGGSRRRRRRAPAARGTRGRANGCTIRSFSESTRWVGMRKDFFRSSPLIARGASARPGNRRGPTLWSCPPATKLLLCGLPRAPAPAQLRGPAPGGGRHRRQARR